MQTRPYPEKNGIRIWLSRSEQQRVLEAADDEPRHRIALHLGLHGLRTQELVQIAPEHVRELSNGAEGHVVIVPDGKSGKRELPISNDLQQSIHYLTSAARLRQDEAIVDVTRRSVRNWIATARDRILDEDDDVRSEWSELGMHDLRRSWATDAYYSLALAGVPIAEELTMSWGGWKHTSTGRETFRENYLGPVPDHVTAEALEHLPMV